VVDKIFYIFTARFKEISWCTFPVYHIRKPLAFKISHLLELKKKSFHKFCQNIMHVFNFFLNRAFINFVWHILFVMFLILKFESTLKTRSFIIYIRSMIYICLKFKKDEITFCVASRANMHEAQQDINASIILIAWTFNIVFLLLTSFKQILQIIFIWKIPPTCLVNIARPSYPALCNKSKFWLNFFLWFFCFVFIIKLRWILDFLVRPVDSHSTWIKK
jgi:hypothetical protein